MSIRAVLLLTAIFALVGWLGLCSFTYYNSPVQQNLWVFLAVLGPTLWATLLPALYRLHPGAKQGEAVLPRVARRSALTALFLVICTGLRFVRALSWANAVLLAVLFILTEVVVSTR